MKCSCYKVFNETLTFSDRRESLAVKMMMMKMFMPSMPEMPGGGEEKKEETAESREEAKEQVGQLSGLPTSDVCIRS